MCKQVKIYLYRPCQPYLQLIRRGKTAERITAVREVTPHYKCCPCEHRVLYSVKNIRCSTSPCSICDAYEKHFERAINSRFDEGREIRNHDLIFLEDCCGPIRQLPTVDMTCIEQKKKKIGKIARFIMSRFNKQSGRYTSAEATTEGGRPRIKLSRLQL